MRIAVRLVIACLLACLSFPSLVRASGAGGEDPYDIGEKLSAKGSDRTALKYYEKARKRGDARAQERIAAVKARLEAERTEDLLDQGRRLTAARRYREAEKALLAAVARPGAAAAAHFLLGDLYLAQEKFAKATAEYRKAKGKY